VIVGTPALVIRVSQRRFEVAGFDLGAVTSGEQQRRARVSRTVAGRLV
jgi:hypothetical protein